MSPSPRRVHHCAASGPGPKKLSETKLGSTNVMAISIGLPTPLVEWTSAERSASHPTSEHHRPSSLTPPRVAYTPKGTERSGALNNAVNRDRPDLPSQYDSLISAIWSGGHSVNSPVDLGTPSPVPVTAPAIEEQKRKRGRNE